MGDRPRILTLKTFCKLSEVNVTNWEQIYIAVYDCVKPKLYRNDFCELLCSTQTICKDEIIKERSILNASTPKIDYAIETLAKKCAENIEKQNLKFGALRQFTRIDGISGKERNLCQEQPIQQVYEYIAVYSLMPLFKAKILPCQYGSIPGRGQIKGTQKIQKILNKDFKDKRVDCIKCDIRKAYPSTSIRVVNKIIRKYCHKNKPLLYLVNAIMQNYPNGHLIIGGYFSTWAFNLVMSFVLRDLLSYKKIRREQTHKLINKIVCYADDFICFGYKTNLIKALKKGQRSVKKNLGLDFQSLWKISSFVERSIQDCEKYRNVFIDMMGFRIYRNRTTIRRKIYKRLRRQFIRSKDSLAKKQGEKKIPIWRARKLAAYNSWLVYSKSNKICFKYNIDYLMSFAIDSISNYSKEELACYERDLLFYPNGSFDFSRWRKNRYYFEKKYRASYQDRAGRALCGV